MAVASTKLCTSARWQWLARTPKQDTWLKAIVVFITGTRTRQQKINIRGAASTHAPVASTCFCSSLRGLWYLSVCQAELQASCYTRARAALGDVAAEALLVSRAWLEEAERWPVLRHHICLHTVLFYARSWPSMSATSTGQNQCLHVFRMSSTDPYFPSGSQIQE